MPQELLRLRLIVSALLATPVVAVSMVMGWQFAGWQWLAFALTTPIVVWGGYPFTAWRGSAPGIAPRRWTR